eukprot:1882230-Rhodomonas_salina.4
MMRDATWNEELFPSDVEHPSHERKRVEEESVLVGLCFALVFTNTSEHVHREMGTWLESPRPILNAPRRAHLTSRSWT